MISMMDSTPSGTRDWVPSFCLRVGQYSAKVLAMRNLYLLPAFEAACCDASWKGGDNAGCCIGGLGRSIGRFDRCVLGACEEPKISAHDAIGISEPTREEELTT